MTKITTQLLEQIRENKKVRYQLAFESPLWFSLLYLRHHFDYPFAPFHLEMFHLIQDPKYKFIVVMAFRDSGKSTIMNTVYALWAVLGKQKAKYIVIISKTLEQAKTHFANVRDELVNNEALKYDFGPFTENDKELEKKLSLELEYNGSKILSMTYDQSIRGLRYGKDRPDLIICDDLEDINSANNRTEIDSLYRRFQSEIIPLGSEKTKIIVLGNLLTENSFIMKIRKDIEDGSVKGIFRAYPLFDDRSKNLWADKFISSEIVKELKNKISVEVWRREYLLNMSNQPTDDYDWSIATPQKALIQQMTEFKISAPVVENFIEPELGDPRYEEYQEHQKYIKKYINEYNERMRLILTQKK